MLLWKLHVHVHFFTKAKGMSVLHVKCHSCRSEVRAWTTQSEHMRNEWYSMGRWDNMLQQLQRLFYRSIYIYIVYIVYINIIYIYIYSAAMMVLHGSTTSHPCSCSFKYHQANTSSQSTHGLSWCIQCIHLMHLLGHWLRWVVILARQVHLDCSYVLVHIRKRYAEDCWGI